MLSVLRRSTTEILRRKKVATYVIPNKPNDSAKTNLNNKISIRVRLGIEFKSGVGEPNS